MKLSEEAKQELDKAIDKQRKYGEALRKEYYPSKADGYYQQFFDILSDYKNKTVIGLGYTSIIELMTHDDLVYAQTINNAVDEALKKMKTNGGNPNGIIEKILERDSSSEETA